MNDALISQQTRRSKLQKIKKAHLQPLNQQQRDKADLALSSLSVDEDKLSEFVNPLEHDLAVSETEINELLDSIHSQLKDNTIDNLIASCKKSITSSISTPFGLGALVAQMDKHGGNVTTVHNAQKGIHASEETEYERGDWTDSHSLSKNKENEFVKHGDENMTVIDRSSGRRIGINDADVDHVISTEKINNDGGYMLSKIDKKSLGKDSANLALMHKSANRSKGSNSYDEFHDKRNSNGRSNKELYEHDKRRTNALQQKANQRISEVITLGVKAEYYAKHAAKTGLNEGGKMAKQQAFGLLLNELLIGVTDEVIDIFRNGLRDGDDKTIVQSIKSRLQRLVEKVASKWKDALQAFKDGAISGFLSNLITMLVNIFVTTLKNTVRLIREGFFVILKALKMAFFPPDGMSHNEAYDAALKLLSAGGVSLIGIAVEMEVSANIEMLLKPIPFISEYAGIVSGVTIGALTGIVSALVAYKLEKMDVFGVNSEKRHQTVMGILDGMVSSSEVKISNLLTE